MTSFQKRRMGKQALSAPLPSPELCRPSNEQLADTLRVAREARTEGATLNFQPSDIIALTEELIEHRMKRALLEKPE